MYTTPRKMGVEIKLCKLLFRAVECGLDKKEPPENGAVSLE